MIPNGWKWNQADELPTHLNSGLLSLVAFDSNRRPYLLGTAFAISAHDKHVGVFCTAGHVIDFAEDIQQTRRAQRAAVLPEFLPPRNDLSIDPSQLRAIHYDGTRVEIAEIDWIVRDGRADVAFLGVRPQERDGQRLFSAEFSFTGASVQPGDMVAVLGYSGMEVLDFADGEYPQPNFKVSRELVLRLGTVTRLHPDGHVLCRTSCFETTIPVSPGMSGSPVVFFGEGEAPMVVCGLVSTSPSTSASTSLDRTHDGASIMVSLSPAVETRADGTKSVAFTGVAPKVVRSAALAHTDDEQGFE